MGWRQAYLSLCVFNFHFVMLKSGRPGCEFSCPAAYLLGLRQFTFLRFRFLSCEMDITEPLGQGSVKKTDIILASSRRMKLNGENQVPTEQKGPLLVCDLPPRKLESCRCPEPGPPNNPVTGSASVAQRRLKRQGAWRQLQSSGLGNQCLPMTAATGK